MSLTVALKDVDRLARVLLRAEHCVRHFQGAAFGVSVYVAFQNLLYVGHGCRHWRYPINESHPIAIQPIHRLAARSSVRRVGRIVLDGLVKAQDAITSLGFARPT